MWEKCRNRIPNGLAICGIGLLLLAVAEFIMLGPGFFNSTPSYMRLVQ
jgi:hypothetical protein